MPNQPATRSLRRLVFFTPCVLLLGLAWLQAGAGAANRHATLDPCAWARDARCAWLNGWMQAPPVAQDDVYTAAEDTPLNVDAPGVLGNDYDPDGDLLLAERVTQPAHGVVVMARDGSFAFTPNHNWYGSDSFVYRAHDAFSSAEATVWLTVTPVNDPPVARNDYSSTTEDTPLTVAAPGLLTNDTDADGDPLTASLDSPPSHGDAAVYVDGSFTYTPEPNWYGLDSFSYAASDGQLSDTATVTVGVTPVNDPPVAADDAYATAENAPLTVDAPGVLANDYDPDGYPLGARLEAPPQKGFLALTAHGAFTYTAPLYFNGVITFTYSAYDVSFSDMAIVTLTVEPVNFPPRAQPNSYSGREDIPLDVSAPGVLRNDWDPDGDPLAAQLVAGPQHGSLTLNPDGSFSYLTDPDWFGVDLFTYAASDGQLNATAVVTLTLAAANDPPAARDDAYPAVEETRLDVAPPGVLANDSDPNGDPLRVFLAAPPQHGSLALRDDGSFSYTPALDWFGADSFAYTAYDGQLGDNATVVITTTNVEDAPVARDDAYGAVEDTPLLVPVPGVQGNDSDPDGDPLIATLLNPPSQGSVLLNPDGSFTYTPPAEWYGVEVWRYTASDGQLDDTAVVFIDVVAVDDPPVTQDDAYSTPQDAPLHVPAPGVLGNDYDPEGKPLTAEIVSLPAHGSLALEDDGSFSYAPDPGWSGQDGFSYSASDGELSSLASVALAVVPPNRPPVAVGDAYSTPQDALLAVPAPGLLGNDYDPDGDALTALLATPPVTGTLELHADGSLFYTPPEGYAGVVRFTYRAYDGQGASNPATVEIRVRWVVYLPMVVKGR